jgi:hypothetical protein
MKLAMFCSALALALVAAATAEAGGPGQKFVGGYYGGNYNGHYQQHGWGQAFGGHGHPHGMGQYGNFYGAPYGYGGHHGGYPVPAMSPPVYNPGPPTAAVTYPYYTTRGPRDFFLNNPPPLGP